MPIQKRARGWPSPAAASRRSIGNFSALTPCHSTLPAYLPPCLYPFRYIRTLISLFGGHNSLSRIRALWRGRCKTKVGRKFAYNFHSNRQRIVVIEPKMVGAAVTMTQPALDDFCDAFMAALRPFGISAFAFGQAPTSGGLGVLSAVRWPQWIEYYAINGFAQYDSAIDEMQSSSEPFTWTELKRRRPEKGARVFEACRRLGWADGFLVPVDMPGTQRGFVSLAAFASLQSLGSNQRTELTHLSRAAYFRSQAHAIDTQPLAPRLPPRELEALNLVADGRNDSDIAAIMAISLSTAHAHVERAKRRLGANTRAQAVALALRAKII
jgi:DNA-binding CsgD family transcriptional regulator